MAKLFKHKYKITPSTCTINLTMMGCLNRLPTLPTHRLPKAFERSSMLLLLLVTPLGSIPNDSQSNQSKTPGNNCRKMIPTNKPARLTDERSGRRSRLSAQAPHRIRQSLHSTKPFGSKFKLTSLFCDTFLIEGNLTLAHRLLVSI